MLNIQLEICTLPIVELQVRAWDMDQQTDRQTDRQTDSQTDIQHVHVIRSAMGLQNVTC